MGTKGPGNLSLYIYLPPAFWLIAFKYSNRAASFGDLFENGSGAVLLPVVTQ